MSENITKVKEHLKLKTKKEMKSMIVIQNYVMDDLKRFDYSKEDFASTELFKDIKSNLELENNCLFIKKGSTLGCRRNITYGVELNPKDSIVRQTLFCYDNSTVYEEFAEADNQFRNLYAPNVLCSSKYCIKKENLADEFLRLWKLLKDSEYSFVKVSKKDDQVQIECFYYSIKLEELKAIQMKIRQIESVPEEHLYQGEEAVQVYQNLSNWIIAA